MLLLHAATPVEPFLYLSTCWVYRNVFIKFIDKTDPSDPLNREDYWRRTHKNMPATFRAKHRKKCLMLQVLKFINFSLYWSLMAYMSARIGSKRLLLWSVPKRPLVGARVVWKPVDWCLLGAS